MLGIDERDLRRALQLRIRVYFVIGQDNRGLFGACLVAHASVLIGSCHLCKITIFVNDHSVLAAKGQGFIGSRCLPVNTRAVIDARGLLAVGIHGDEAGSGIFCAFGVHHPAITQRDSNSVVWG